MNALDKQTNRIILLRGALELIANSNDIVFTQAWAQRALDRDLEFNKQRVQVDIILCAACGLPEQEHSTPDIHHTFVPTSLE